MISDLEQVMILLQRRYNALREISRLTDELQEAVSREDYVSASLLLEIRGDELEKYEVCQVNILLLAEKGPEQAQLIRELVFSDAVTARPPDRPEEQKIHELRRRSLRLIRDIREKDRSLNQRVGGGKSYYTKINK